MGLFSSGNDQMKKHTTSLTLDPEVLSRFKAKFGNVSGTVENLMRQSLADSDREGLQVSPEEYSLMLGQYEDMSKEADKLVERLQKQRVYDSLENVASEVGVDFEGFKNLDDVIPELYKHWDQPRDYMVRYIAWLETLKQKRRLERRIFTIQTAKLKVVAPAVAVPNEAIPCGAGP